MIPSRFPLALSAPPVVMGILLTACSPQPGTTHLGDKQAPGADAKEPLTRYDAVSAIEIVDSPATGVALGWGWNRGDSEPVPTICVEFVPGEEPAQTRYMTMQEVSDNYTLMKSLGVSAEASVKAIGYEASGKAAFAKSMDLSSERSTFVLNAVVQNGVRYTAPVPDDPIPAGEAQAAGYQPAVNERGGSRGAVRLTPEALALAKKRDGLEAFKHRCGSAFVSAIYGGAKLTAALSFVTESLEQKETLSADLSGGGWGARFESKLSESKTSGSRSERMDLSLFMTGGKGDTIPATQQDLTDKLQTISLDAYVAPKDFQIAITPYEVLSNWPGKILPDKQTEFDELASYWGSYNTLYDEIQQALDNPQDYVAVSRDADGCLVVPSCSVQREALTASQQTLKLMTENRVEIPGWEPIFKQIEKPMVEARDKAKAALAQCEKDNSLASTVSADKPMQALKRAQDEVLVKLRRMQEEARICSDRSDVCDFSPNNYRSPYAFRIQLPMPAKASLTHLDELTDLHVGRTAKQRCSISSTDPGCLTNRQIDEWGEKLGFIPVTRQTDPEGFALYQTRLESMDKAATADQASTKPGCVPQPYSYEQGRDDVIWYNPAYRQPAETDTGTETQKGA
ncbi:MAG: hypothetical protein ABW101_15905 [Candidatus Thiodiazotropha sp.]